MRIATLISGLLLTLLGILLWVASFTVIGINDGEWGHVSRTGSISRPDLFTWSDWRNDDEAIDYFSQHRGGKIDRFRSGYSESLLFSFTAYQIESGATVYPALGPNWGASYNYIWMIISFVAGLILVAVSELIARRLTGAEQGAAANP